MNKYYIAHHGILGQKWGVRRFQNEDGSLTPAGQRKMEQKDNKWIEKKADKIYENAYKDSKKEMSKYVKENLSGQSGMKAVNNYNRKLAEVMRTKTSNIRSPSGRVVEWVAKRGQMGVHMALADVGYDIGKLKNGVWENGRIGYKKDKVDVHEK